MSASACSTRASFDVQDADDDQVDPPIVIKLADFDFVSYADRKAREVTPWLEAAVKKQRRN